MLEKPETTKSDQIRYWRLYWRLVQLGVGVIFVASVGTFLTILRNPEWHTRLLRLLDRAWDVFVAQDVGSTNRGFFNGLLEALLSIILVAIMTGYLHGLKEFKKHLMETAIIALFAIPIITFVVYGTQFAWEVAKTGYQDHYDLSVANKTLRLNQKKLTDPGPLNEEILELQGKIDKLSRQPVGRFVTGKQVSQGAEALRKFPQRDVVGIATFRDNERMEYALQLADVFEKAGWTPLLYCMQRFGQDQQGIVLPQHQQSNMPSIKPLRATLDAMGVRYAIPGSINATEYPINSIPCELRPVNKDGSPWQKYGGQNLSTDQLVLFVGSK